eukprot:366436-Chlamydomonas_euryale.AAC.11
MERASTTLSSCGFNGSVRLQGTRISSSASLLPEQEHVRAEREDRGSLGAMSVLQALTGCWRVMHAWPFAWYIGTGRWEVQEVFARSEVHLEETQWIQDAADKKRHDKQLKQQHAHSLHTEALLDSTAGSVRQTTIMGAVNKGLRPRRTQADQAEHARQGRREDVQNHLHIFHTLKGHLN